MELIEQQDFRDGMNVRIEWVDYLKRSITFYTQQFLYGQINRNRLGFWRVFNFFEFEWQEISSDRLHGNAIYLLTDDEVKEYFAKSLVRWDKKIKEIENLLANAKNRRNQILENAKKIVPEFEIE
ncbi:MAG: hypothetical protein WCT18_01370 [Patescibacteria group bacterium]